MEARKLFIITNQYEYEEVMNLLHSFRVMPRTGSREHLQWLELKESIETWEKENKGK